MNVTVTKHPGKIVYVDGNSQQVTNERPATEVPESLRFAETPSGLEPVVKVIATVEGDRRFIREYGVDGALLRSTVQIRTPS